MKIVRSIAETRSVRAAQAEPLGLVPTMGYLHEGHLSLVRRAKAECQSVAVSIYVNPTQFGPQEDLEDYPRDLDRDLAMLENEGTDLVWLPIESEMYGPFYQTWVTVEELTKRLEGSHRPGHFRGVTTIVMKLFNVIQPQKAYFGQKDAQQALVVRRMVHDLNVPLEIVVCPTIREPDGLAMSSRNAYLNDDERKAAPVLYRALLAAQQAFGRGEKDAQSLRKTISGVLEEEPLARTQYVSIADLETLDELEDSIEKALVSLAVFMGRTRLIDNVVIGDD